MIPENFPLAENIGPGHVPRHGSVTGTATERQQPLPCRLQAPAGNAAVFPGQAPRFGEPFFLAMGRSVRTHQTAHGRTRQEKCRLAELPGRAAGKGLCRCAGHDGCRSSPVAREKTGVRRGRGRIAVPRLMTALRQGPGGDRSGASPGALSATGMEQERRAPLLRPCHTSATGRLRREDGSAGGERSALLPSGLAICGLLVYGSSFIEAHSGSGPGCPAMRYGAFFVVFRSWGRGRRQAGLQGLGRCGRSQPFWRIEKWLTSA